jgi:hypothetical protein
MPGPAKVVLLAKAVTRLPSTSVMRNRARGMVESARSAVPVLPSVRF